MLDIPFVSSSYMGDRIQSVKISDGNKILITGVFTKNNSDGIQLKNFFAEKLDLGGAFDADFGDKGKIVLEMKGRLAPASAIDGKGNIIVVNQEAKPSINIYMYDKNGHLISSETASHQEAIKEEVQNLFYPSKADVHGTYGSLDQTLLMRAIAEGSGKEVVEEILAEGADINFKNKHGLTALMVAAGTDPEIVKLLLSKGADIDAKDNRGETALQKAIENGKKDIVDLLHSRGASLNSQVPVLVEAAGSGNKELVELFLSQGIDVNARDGYGRTALESAAGLKEGHGLEIVNFLLFKGAEINSKDRYGVTALMQAALINNQGIIESLVSSGADVNAKDDHGKSVLMYALFWNDIKSDVIEFLLSKGAEINAKDNQGRTALMWALKNNSRPELIKLLLSKGADVNAEDAGGNTAWSYTKNPAVEAILEARGIKKTGKINGSAIF